MFAGIVAGGSMFLNPLRLFLVDPHQIVPSRTFNTQQFVQLSMKGLCVTVLGSLDEEGHSPNYQSYETMRV